MDISWIKYNHSLFKFSSIQKNSLNALSGNYTNFSKTMESVTPMYGASSDDNSTQFPGNGTQGNATGGMYEFYRVSVSIAFR